MAAFGAADPSDRAAFDARWMRILADPAILVRAIEVDADAADGDPDRGSGRRPVLAGSILLWRDPDLPGPEVSYWLGRPFWGRGIATEALRLFLSDVAIRPLFGRAAADNAASIRVLEHCGFLRSGEDHGWSDALGRTVPEVILRLDR